jgi:tetratricopeptide (TPR) repeat protein
MTHQADLAKARELHKAGRIHEAEPAYRRILDDDPRNAEALHLLGLAAHQSGRHEEAAAFIHDALRIEPDNGKYHLNLGCAELALGRLMTAEASFRRALEIDSDEPMAHFNLGNALAAAGKFEDAAKAYQKAHTIDPADPRSPYNMGKALYAAERFNDAAEAYAMAVRADPGFTGAERNRGLALKAAGRLEEAIDCLKTAVAQEPQDPLVHGAYGSALLLAGRLEEGWPENEWRLKKPDHRRLFSEPLWDGSDLDGRAILIEAEQGYGDTIQFIRYAAMLKDMGATVIFHCFPRMRRLLAGVAGIDRMVRRGEMPPDFDVQAPLMSLPAIFGTTLETIPAATSYIPLDEDAVETWSEKLAAYPGLKIGLCWQGDKGFKGDKWRSLAPEHMVPLVESRPGDTFISLQTGGSEALEGLIRQNLIEGEGGPDAFVLTAPIIRNLDLVITTDTAVAHLAGALGARTWVLLQSVPEWRWLMERPDSPWYPSMRLFRQPAHQDWPAVIGEVTAALDTL